MGVRDRQFTSPRAFRAAIDHVSKAHDYPCDCMHTRVQPCRSESPERENALFDLPRTEHEQLSYGDAFSCRYCVTQ